MIGDFSDIRSKLELVFASLGPAKRDHLKKGLDELAGIVKLLGCISIGRKVLFRPTLAHNAAVSHPSLFPSNVSSLSRDIVLRKGIYV